MISHTCSQRVLGPRSQDGELQVGSQDTGVVGTCCNSQLRGNSCTVKLTSNDFTVEISFRNLIILRLSILKIFTIFENIEQFLIAPF